MLYLVGLAFRNVRRNTRRSLLAILSVTLAIMFIVFMQGMIGGLMGSMVKNYTKNETGHIRISTREFADKVRFYPVNENMARPDSVISAIMGDPAVARHIEIITERVNVGVLLSHRGNNKTAVALAGDPETEEELLLLNKSILPGGRYLRGEREAILGAGIARALDYEVGDTIKVVTQGSDFALHMRSFVIVGLFETGLKALDDAVFQIPLGDAKRLLRMRNEAQQIIVMLDDYRRAGPLAETIERRLNDPTLSVRDWMSAGEYGGIVEMSRNVYGILYGVIALLGAFIIGNIMMMVVLERRREIGVLKSMGLKAREVLFLFVAEGVVLGFVGSVAGVLLGSGVSLFFHYHGLDFTKAMSSVSIPMDSVVHTTLEPAVLIQALVLGTIVSAVVSLVPSWQASRMDPVHAIKSV